MPQDTAAAAAASMRTQAQTQLLKEAKNALDSFLSSSAPFRIVRTLPSTLAASVATPSQHKPRTLFVLDSSYNPPSVAHATLCLSAVRSSQQRDRQSSTSNNSTHKPSDDPAQRAADAIAGNHPPRRLLLLFGTQNADKSPSPAAFEHRLAMMMVFAEDLVNEMSGDEQTSTIPIDVGLCKYPMYVEKSTAIEETGAYGEAPGPQHVHLAGYDSLIRIFNPKYYPDHDPPLSALEPFFRRHALRVTIRPDDEWGSAEDQRRWVRGLAEGASEDKGARREWVEHIEMVEASKAQSGVSSTKVRQKAEQGRWQELHEQGLCTSGVVGWMRAWGLYGSAEPER